MTPAIAPVSFAEAALFQIRQTFQSKNLPADYALRIGLKGAGCGASYLLGLDKANEHDDQFEIEGIKVLIDRRHLMYLFGVEIGFDDGEDGQGFFFNKAVIWDDIFVKLSVKTLTTANLKLILNSLLVN